jgi:asparagine synthetase B (glutamine-hydrolysing)
MDTTVPDIQFDENGVCNYCQRYEERVKAELNCDASGQLKLESLIADIKRRGVHSDYDCLIGVSGGVDSTYVAYLVRKRFGLRPLAVHLDNGWDSELAVNNIERTMKQLDIDLYTHVLDWEEFKDLQIAFLKASIANAEIPTDQAIMAVMFHTAALKGIHYIITGYNIVSEAILPESWMYDSKDVRLIKAVQRKFGTM